jgi:chromosome segregation ATPase
MELAALHQVLFDVTLAITRRNEELQDLEARAGKAQAILDEAAATQAEAASRHQEMQAKLEQARSERQKLDQDTEAARQRYEDLLNSGSVLQDKLAALEEKVVALDNTCQDLETVIATQSTEKERVEQGLEQLTASLSDFQEKKRQSEKELGESLAARAAESDLASAALARIRDALFQTQLQNESLTRTREEHQATITGLEAQLERLTAETTGLETTLGSKSAALAELQAKTGALTSSLAEIQAEAHAREEALTIRCRQLEAAAERAAAKLEQAEATLPTITTRHESLTRECQEHHLSLQAARDEKAALAAELQQLKTAAEEKAAERSALDRELMQTRRDLHELKLQAATAETEFQARQAGLEAELEKISTAHQRSQQALSATQTRHQDLLLKQDEALHELEQRQAKLAALSSQQETLIQEVARLTATREEASPDGPLSAAHTNLESLKKEAGALEKAIAEKSTLHQTLSQELHTTFSALAAAQETARQEHGKWEAHRQTMEAELAAHKAALQSSRESLLIDQSWHQDLSNRQSTALNDLNAAQAAIATLQAEAKALEKVIQERHSQKEALIEEIHRANNTVTNLYNSQDPATASQTTPNDSEIGDVIQHLMRLVDAADTAHAFIGKSLTVDATNGQFNHLREAITSTLGKLGIRELKLTPGTPVDTTMRRQIQVVKNLNGENAPWIHSIISPGFIKEMPEGKTVLLRKPEVIVSSEALPATS